VTKLYPDVNDTLMAEGPEGVKRRHEKAKRYNGADAAPEKLILTLPEFLAGYIPPDYLIDGLMQQHFFYSFTGNTGDGKTAIALLLAVYVAMGGQHLGPHEVEHGRVVYIAKENATDIRQRLIGMATKIGFDPELLAEDFLVIEQLDSLDKDTPRIAKEVEAFGPVALVVIDTSAATFAGDDENNNAQMIAHAKIQRRLCDLPGRPCVLALCHPPKNANTKEQLVPRGGGAFLAEVDGNFTAFGHGDKLSDLHWTGKLRGPDFDKITFRFVTVYTNKLADAKGRVLPTVMAEIVTEEQAAENEEKAVFQENRLLAAMVAKPHGSLAQWADHCGWTLATTKPGEQAKPNKALAQRVMKRLMDRKFVRTSGRSYELTKDGIKAAQNPAEAAA
jgi:AAA domain